MGILDSITGKVVGGAAKLAGKAVVGTAKVVGKGAAAVTKGAAKRAVGKAVLNFSGIDKPDGGFNSAFESSVGEHAIDFAGKHKKGLLIGGASLAAASAVGSKVSKRDVENFDEDDFAPKKSYKKSISDYLDTNKRVLFRKCPVQNNSVNSNFKINKEGGKAVKDSLKHTLKNSKIIDFLDLRDCNGYYTKNGESYERLVFFVLSEAFLILVKKNDKKTFFNKSDYKSEAFFLSGVAVDKKGRLLVSYKNEVDDEDNKRTSLYVDLVDEEISNGLYIYFDNTDFSEEQLAIFIESLYAVISKRERVKIKEIE